MNKRERMEAALRNQRPDRTPAAFWFHHSCNENADTLARQQVDLYREADMDYVKIMYDLEYSLDFSIRDVSDWNHIRPQGKKSPYYKKQLEIIKKVLDEVNGECMVFNTSFGPMRHAVWLMDNSNDKMQMAIAEDQDSVKNGVMAIAECMTEWMDGFTEAGADGIFYAAQFGEPGRFTEEQWSSMIKESDLMILNQIRRHSNSYILLHPCGQPAYRHKVDLNRYLDYPRDAVNYAVHANHLKLEEGRALFGCPVMGGLDNRGAIEARSGDCTSVGNN